MLQGDLGESYKLKQEVSDLILARLPVTFELILFSVILAVGVAIPLGVYQARRRDSFGDYAGSLFALVAVSSPVYFTAILGVLVFAVGLGVLPAFGRGGPDLLDQARHLLLPAVTLALGMIALTSRMTRSAMIEVLSSDFIEAARAKGLPERTVVVKHGLRNALIPVLTVTSLQIGFLLVGTVLVESTLGLGGLGSLITDSIQNRDYPVIQASVLLLTVRLHAPEPAHRPDVRGHRPPDPVRMTSTAVGVPSFRRRLGASALVRNRAAVVGLLVLLPLLLATIVPWLLTSANPNAQDLSQSLLGSSWTHPLGTDKPGRDVLARVIFGAAPTLLGAMVVVVISGVVGIPAGLFAGYYGGRTESIIMRILDALLAFPALLLAILVVATFGRGLTTAVLALGVIYIPAMARLVRSVTLVQRSQAYVDAGVALGYSDSRIIFRHILPNLVAAIVVQSSIDLAYAILDIAALSFLGLGQQPPDPDWGSMLSDGRSYLIQNPLPAMSAGLAIMLAVIAFNLVGDGLRAQLDPRERQR